MLMDVISSLGSGVGREGGRGYNCLIISAWETQGLGLQTGVAGDSPGEAGC